MQATANGNSAGKTRALDEHPVDIEWIDIEEVKRMAGMCLSSVYAAVAQKRFPAPIKIGRSSRWIRAEVQVWQRELVAAARSKA
jgi:prophage regulatory protein